MLYFALLNFVFPSQPCFTKVALRPRTRGGGFEGVGARWQKWQLQETEFMCPASILNEVLFMNHWFLFSTRLLGCHSEGVISMLLKNGKYQILGYDMLNQIEKNWVGCGNKKTQPPVNDITLVNQIHNALCVLYPDYGAQIHFHIGNAPSPEILERLGMANL